MLLDNRSRYEEIEQEVADLYEECAQVVSLPLNLLKICKTNHIFLCPYSSLSKEKLDEALRESDDGFTRLIKINGFFRYCIYFNDSQPRERIRFTVAHEIGHIRLGHLESNKLPYEIKEAEANYFAKHLLCPYPVSNKLGLESPEDFAKTFHVSKEAAEYTYISYTKWLQFGSPYFEEHEMTILEAFGMV